MDCAPVGAGGKDVSIAGVLCFEAIKSPAGTTVQSGIELSLLCRENVKSLEIVHRSLKAKSRDLAVSSQWEMWRPGVMVKMRRWLHTAISLLRLVTAALP
jgi:hypothetical protein